MWSRYATRGGQNLYKHCTEKCLRLFSRIGNGCGPNETLISVLGTELAPLMSIFMHGRAPGRARSDQICGSGNLEPGQTREIDAFGPFTFSSACSGE